MDRFPGPLITDIVPTFGNFLTLSFNLLAFPSFFGRIFGSVSLTLENVALFNTSIDVSASTIRLTPFVVPNVVRDLSSC